MNHVDTRCHDIITVALNERFSHPKNLFYCQNHFLVLLPLKKKKCFMATVPELKLADLEKPFKLVSFV